VSGLLTFATICDMPSIQDDIPYMMACIGLFAIGLVLWELIRWLF
jgi:hypothetical protein